MIDTEYKVNNGQISKIHVLLGKLSTAMNMTKEEVKEYKASLVRQYTDNRETSTTRLSWKEANDMIAALVTASPRPSPKERELLSEGDIKADCKRKLILHYAHQMGWHAPSTGGKQKLDMERVNNWCVKYGVYHKVLNEHTLSELSKLVAQFERVYKSYLNSI